MLRVVTLIVVMLSVIMLRVITLIVVMLSVIMLSVIMLSVIMLSVMAPLKKPVVEARFFLHRVFVPGLACYSWVQLGALPSNASLG